MTHSSDASKAAKDAFSPPDLGSSPDPAISQALQSSLEVGLAALKQKDYPTAIEHLETCQTSTDGAIRLKAQTGLIKAYVRTGQMEAARSLCQPLCQHTNPQVQTWAKQTLAELASHSRRSSAPAPTSTDAAPIDTTGFTPLDADATGFMPISRPAESVRSSNPAQPPVRSTPQPAARSTTPQQPGPPDLSQPSLTPSSLQPTPASDPPSSPSSHPASRSTSGSVSPPAVTHSALAPSFLWRNAGRSSRWNSLGAVDASGLWALEVGSLVLLFWLSRLLLRWIFSLWNGLSIRVNWATGLPRLILPTDLTWPILILLGLLLLTSPWLLNRWLKQFYRLQPFSLANLERSSPEANRLLRRVLTQRRQPMPTFQLLPNSAPLVFTYGYLPQNAHIVVSQGLLDQLPDDEIATLMAAELAHIRYWNFGVLSGLVLIAQIPYRIYWSVAAWGDRQQDRVLKTIAVAISSFGYGLFWLLRLPGLWLARVRLYYSDRFAAELTGNPNGLSRALLKITIGTAQNIQQQKHTSALLESFEMLLPVGYRQALTLGSLYNGDAALLDWDRRNPYRRWLILNNTHPPLGERLHLLTQYAQQWRLEPEVLWRRDIQANQNQRNGLSYKPRRLLLQGAPFWGIPIGLGIGLLLWAFGWIARQLRWFEVAWLAGDRSMLLACCLLGFSIGMFLRINAFFPDIRPSNLQSNPALAQLLNNPTAIPLDSQPVRLQGTLVGRRGLHNWLYRDLILQTATGLIRLHYTSSWGWIGDLFPKALRPPALIDRSVTVTGWFRRGATPWIDVETIQSEYGRTLRSYHPIWSTILASLAALLAVYIILRGGS